MQGTIFSNLDSIVIANMVLNADTLFSSVSFSDSLKSFIYNNSDTLFGNRIWLDSLTTLIKDSIDSDVDSLVLSALDTLYLYENGRRISVYLPDLDSSNELIQSISLIGDSIAINENGTFHYLNIKSIVNSFETVTTISNTDSTITYTNENGVSTILNIKSMVDSSETVTSITFTDSSLTYFSENGRATFINIGAMIDSNETITTLVDNGDSTFTYTNERGIISIINYRTTGTVTTLTDNGDSTFTYTNELGATTTVNFKTSGTVTTLTDNGNGTFTYVNELGTPVTFNTKDTVVTTLVDNGDSTFTYTNELGATTTINYKSKGVVTTLSDNNNGTFTYTNENGVGVTFDTKDTNTTKFGQIGDSVYYVDGFGDTSKVYVNNDTVITTLVDNGNGIFTYTNEAGTVKTINTKDTVVTTLVDNGNGVFTYTNEAGTVTTINTKDTVVTTITDNGDSTFTYRNELGATTTINYKSKGVVTTLSDNNNGTFTYTNENGVGVTFDTKDTVLTTLVLDTDTLIYTDENGVETKLNLEDLDSINEKIDTAYFINDSIVIIEGGDTSIIPTLISDSSEWSDLGAYILATRAALGGNNVSVTDQGRIGIGTTTPNNWINIVTNTGNDQGVTIRNTSALSNHEAAIRLERVGSFFTLFHRNDFTGFYTNAPQGFKLITSKLITFGGPERMRIDTFGNVGIGQANPLYRLDLTPGAGLDPIRIRGLNKSQTNDTQFL